MMEKEIPETPITPAKPEAVHAKTAIPRSEELHPPDGKNEPAEAKPAELLNGPKPSPNGNHAEPAAAQVAEKEHKVEQHPAFKENFYRFRRAFFIFWGGKFDVYDKNDKLIMYSDQKPAVWKEEFYLYSDKSRKEKLLEFKTPQRVDVHSEFFVTDLQTDEKVGSVKREWLPSILRDEWTFYAPDRVTKLGKLVEKSRLRSIIARIFGSGWIPQQYKITTPDENVTIAEIDQHFNPFVLNYDMRILQDIPSIDKRLLTAMGVLLCGVEQRQKSWLAGRSPHTDNDISNDISSLQPATA